MTIKSYPKPEINSILKPHCSTNGSVAGDVLDQNIHDERPQDVVDDRSEHRSVSDAHGDALDGREEYPDIVSSMETLNMSRSNSETAAIDDILNGAQKEVKFSNASEHPVHEEIQKQARYTKQHTGLKNLSFNVGAAVAPTEKMEFDQEERESFGVVKIGRPVGGRNADNNSDAQSTVSSVGSEGRTDQGYFDLKFYHNKLWWINSTVACGFGFSLQN